MFNACRQFYKSGLVTQGKLSYYEYMVHATNENSNWKKIEEIHSDPKFNYTSLRKSLAQEVRKLKD